MNTQIENTKKTNCPMYIDYVLATQLKWSKVNSRIRNDISLAKSISSINFEDRNRPRSRIMSSIITLVE